MFSLSCPVSDCCFLSCITLSQPSEHRLTGDLQRFKMLLLGKGVILFLCTFCCDCECEILVREPWQKIFFFYRVIF